jgi:hypothetical protein
MILLPRSGSLRPTLYTGITSKREMSAGTTACDEPKKATDNSRNRRSSGLAATLEVLLRETGNQLQINGCEIYFPRKGCIIRSSRPPAADNSCGAAVAV